MAFIFTRTLDGSAPITKYYSLPGITTVVKNDLCYFDAAGNISNVTAASCVTDNVAGVAEETVNGATGSSMIAIQVNRMAVYRVDTTAVGALTDVGTNVALDTPRIISESTPATDRTGVCRIIAYINATTAQSEEVTINFSEP